MTTTEQNILTMVRAFAEIIERQVTRFENQGAEHERKLAEYRAAFAARTGADEKIIEGLRIQVQDKREEIIRVNEAHGRTKVENDGLLDELAAQRDAFTAEVERIRRELCEGRDALRAEVASLQERLRASIARGDFAQMELAQLKSPTPKHPVAVGGYLRRLTGFNTTPAGEVARVTLVDDADPSQLEYEVVRPNGQKGRWSAKGCEPCDPPATHDTPEGRSVAESVIRDFRTTEPAADIKEGDIVEVVSATHKIYTDPEDIGLRGVVTAIAGMRLSVRKVPGYELPICGIVGKCDVRKVDTDAGKATAESGLLLNGGLDVRKVTT